MLEREGVAPVCAPSAGADGEHPPCPACGTAAPLVDGACSDCGLKLDDTAPNGGSCGVGGCR
jgi:predicted amidophosphoribosyltransferase